LCDPLIRTDFEKVESEASSVQHFVVERTNVELGAKLFSGTFAQFEEFELTDLVAASLRRPCNIPINFRLDCRFVDSAGFSHKLDGLVARPSVGVDSRVDYEAYSTPKFGGEATVLGSGILVEANLLPESFGVQRPPFYEGREAQTLKPEPGQSSELPLNRKLHVVSRDTFVVGDGFIID
jgi:hypothetical protein